MTIEPGSRFSADFPVIGALFRTRSKTKMRTELIVLMRPEVSLTQVGLVSLAAKTARTGLILVLSWNKMTVPTVLR